MGCSNGIDTTRVDMLHKDQILEENQVDSRLSENPEFEADHRALLDKIIDLDCSIKGQDLHVISIETSGGGAGAAAFRELFILRNNRKLTGDIYALSSGTNACLFYLYMGMIPCQFVPELRKKLEISQIYTPYINTFFIDNQGNIDTEKSKHAFEILNAFLNGHEVSEQNMDILRKIIDQEKTRRTESPGADDKVILSEIATREISILEGQFIPNMLNDLRDDIFKKEIDLSRAGGCIEFKMTNAAFKRAHEAIGKSEKILSFKKLEHLPLNSNQRKELADIMRQRNEFMRKSSASSNPVILSDKSFMESNKPDDDRTIDESDKNKPELK
jgi:hypothetical protein